MCWTERVGQACAHVYPGNVADVEEFSVALARIKRMLDESQIARDSVTLVIDERAVRTISAWRNIPRPLLPSNCTA